MASNGTEQGLRVVSLLPAASSLSALDILLPPLLLLIALGLYDLQQSSKVTQPIAGHVIRTKTHHARFLPAESAHAFAYPGLYLGLDLASLEASKLDRGRLFRWQHPYKYSILGVGSSSYLHAPKHGESAAIRLRLLGELARHGVGCDIERVYTVSMPAYAAFEGINPLVTHFAYTRAENEALKLAVVVLEVHNTFAERHVYVLQVGVKEDEPCSKGFEHQWTFPRSFHVSPFNDRSGSYRVSVVDPLGQDPPHSLTHLPPHPHLNIKILLLTADAPSQKKLLATLEGRGEPMTPPSLLRALCALPFSLFLTTPRILYEATRLHYRRRLDVYPRPELFVGSERPEDAVLNPVSTLASPGSVLWQTATDADRWARSLVERDLRDRCAKLDLAVELVPEDRAVDGRRIGDEKANEVLKITYASPLLFSDLLIAPSAAFALAIADDRWRVSDPALFAKLYVPSTTPSLSRAARTARALRHRYARWLRSFAREEGGEEDLDLPERHAFDDLASWSLVRHLWTRIVTEKLGHAIFRATGARFVEGTEPWTVLARHGRDRGVKLAESIRTRGAGIGSVRRS